MELRKSPQNNIFSDQVKISLKRQLFFWSIFQKQQQYFREREALRPKLQKKGSNQLPPMNK